MSKRKYQRTRKDGKPFAKTLSGYKQLRLEDGAPYTIWVGKKDVKKKSKKGTSPCN